MTDANNLYIIVHKDDAAWMVGDVLDGLTKHAVRHSGYDRATVATWLEGHPNFVMLRVTRNDPNAAGRIMEV